MNYFFEGALKSIGETQTFGEKFKKREFVVVTEDKYPESVKFEFVNDDVDALDKYMVGEMVTVAFVIRGNEYQGKHYVNLKAIAIGELVEGRVEAEFEKNKAKFGTVDYTAQEELVDDLPF